MSFGAFLLKMKVKKMALLIYNQTSQYKMQILCIYGGHMELVFRTMHICIILPFMYTSIMWYQMSPPFQLVYEQSIHIWIKIYKVNDTG